MNYEFSIEIHAEYVRVLISGEPSRERAYEQSFDVGTHVVKACRESNIRRILAVWDVPGRLAVVDAYELAGNPQAFGFDYDLKLASVYLHRDRFEGSKFAETVATNRGFNVKVFNEEEAALAWLLEP